MHVWHEIGVLKWGIKQTDEATWGVAPQEILWLNMSSDIV